jgi:hypothetical protein
MDSHRFGLGYARLRVLVIALALVAAAAFVGISATRASADTVIFGSDLSAPATLDTANGAYPGGRPGAGSTVIAPNPHAAADTSVWNTAGPATLSSPLNGQILSIQLEGCAREDMSAPMQTSLGVPVNMIAFQTLNPSGGNYTVATDIGDDATGVDFTLPFCSESSDVTAGQVNTSTVTTYTPLHVCLNQGSFVDFHDIGGFVPAQNGQGPWYPEGVPFDVLTSQAGAGIDSYIEDRASLPGDVFSPSDTSPTLGWGSQTGEQVQMEIVLATGGDEYRFCPGGTAQEPLRSNQVTCDVGTATNGHPLCNSAFQPITGTSSGTSTGTGTKGSTPGVRTAAPKVGQLLLNHTVIRPKTGLTVGFSDTVTATTTIGITREVFGRKSGKQCVTKVERRLRHDPVCRFFQKLGSIRHVDTIGRNSVHLKTDKLSRGTYQVTLVSRFGTHRSRTLVQTFKIK